MTPIQAPGPDLTTQPPTQPHIVLPPKMWVLACLLAAGATRHQAAYSLGNQESTTGKSATRLKRYLDGEGFPPAPIQVRLERAFRQNQIERSKPGVNTKRSRSKLENRTAPNVAPGFAVGGYITSGSTTDVVPALIRSSHVIPKSEVIGLGNDILRRTLGIG
jgi:hypothetical protein